MSKLKRHPMAIAADKFEASDQFKRATDPTNIGSTEQHRQYLENRIACAFREGWDAAIKHILEAATNAK